MDLTPGIIYLFAVISLSGGVLLGGLLGGLIATGAARSRTRPKAEPIASGCLGSFIGFLCHGTAGLIGLAAATVLIGIYERCTENCGDYHATVLLAVLLTVHAIALVITIFIVQRRNRLT